MRDDLITEELDIFLLARVILRKAWLVILVAVIGASVMFYRSAIATPDSYTASALMYVYTNNPNQTSYQYANTADLNTAVRLLDTYSVVIRSKKVLDAVAERIGPPLTAEMLQGLIRVDSVSRTEVMRISVTSPDPYLSMNICNAVAECAPGEIIRVVNAGQVVVIDYASLPESRDSKGVMTNVVVGGGAGAMLVCGALLLLFMRDRHIQSDETLRERFPIEILASIPGPKAGAKKRARKAAKAAGLAAGKDGKEILEKITPFVFSRSMSLNTQEIYRRLRIGVDSLLDARDNNVLMVISSIPSEGKSLLSANLAISSAVDGRRTLLMEADIRRPTQHRIFGLPMGQEGLTDVLAQGVGLDAALSREVHPQLDVLTAGRDDVNPMQLLGSLNMRKLLDRVSREYDLVVIDTPPINLVADALALAPYVGGALFSVRRGVSGVDEIEHTLTAAGRANLEILGFVYSDALEPWMGWSRRRYYDAIQAGHEA